MRALTLVTERSGGHVVWLERVRRRPVLRRHVRLRVGGPEGGDTLDVAVGPVTQWPLPNGDWVVAGTGAPRSMSSVALEFEGGGTVRAGCVHRSWLAIVPGVEADRPFTVTWLAGNAPLDEAELPPMVNTVDDGEWEGYAPLAAGRRRG